MQFADPKYLNWLIVIPFIFFLLVYAFQSRRRRLRSFAQYAELLGLTGRFSIAGAMAKTLLVVIGATALVIALAGPRWGFDWQEVKQSGMDIMVVVDVSESMLATDVNPSRLEKAKREIYDLIGSLRGDRIGIIAFAGVSFVQCPLTIDYNAARNFLSYLRTDLIPVQGSAVGEALELADKSLESSGEAKKGEQVVILITDGEDHGENAMAAAEKLRARGVKIYAVGLGDAAGAPVPDLENGGFKQDSKGNIVLSKLNEGLLKSLATTTGGNYRRSAASGFSLDSNFFGDLGIQKSAVTKDTKIQKWHERYQWFALLAFICLALDLVLREYRKREA